MTQTVSRRKLGLLLIHLLVAGKHISFSSELNTSTSSQSPVVDHPPAATTGPTPDLPLPLKVRFIGDEDRVFKIIWVSPDFKEFHTEYQGQLYSNLADFVNKVLKLNRCT